MNRWEKLEKKPAPMFTKKFGPLSGIRVLLNGTVVAAPFAATMFSDFGAEVIALERPKVKGDTARHQKPQVTNGDKHISGAWIWLILFIAINTVINVIGIEWTNRFNWVMLVLEIIVFII